MALLRLPSHSAAIASKVGRKSSSGPFAPDLKPERADSTRISMKELSLLFRRGIMSSLGKKHKGNFQALFSEYDTDGDGSWSEEEIFQICTRLSPGIVRRSLVKNIIMEMDTNNDGVVQFEEFSSYLLRENIMEKMQSPEEIRVLFDKVDKDSSGEIDPVEVSSCVVPCCACSK